MFNLPLQREHYCTDERLGEEICMADALELIEIGIGAVSNTVWTVFLPCVLAAGIFLVFRTFTKIQPQTTEPSDIHFADVAEPCVISLGAMIGTGAIIGVLGSLSSLAGSGQPHIEALAIWALIGALIMVPVSYAETLCSKVMGKTPKEYVAMLLSPKLAVVYAVCFCLLHIFGFGGFQFSGIDSVVTIITEDYLEIVLTENQRFWFIVVPLIAVVAAVILSKKNDLFLNTMNYMVGISIGAYFIFFGLFFLRTSSHFPVYLRGMLDGLKNPVNAILGMPLGLIMSMQRVLQCSETGLGTLALSAHASDAKPRAAAQVSLLPTIITIFVSIVVTSYIASYGMEQGLIQFPAHPIARLEGFFFTARAVAGDFGLVVLCLFTLLSGLSVLFSSYYFLNTLFHRGEDVNVIIYLVATVTAGILAVYGFDIVFDVVDLLLFVVCSINVAALTVFAVKKWKTYRL